MSDARIASLGRGGRKNVLLSYSIFMLIVVAVVASILGAVLTDFVRNHVIRMHAAFYAETLSSAFSIALPGGSKSELSKAHDELEREGHLLHVKNMSIWNAAGSLIYGEASSFAGALGGVPLQDALRGSLRFEYRTTPARRMLDIPRGDLALYLPIRAPKGDVAGVVGLIESDEALADDLSIAARTIAFYVSIAGTAIYAALFMLYFGSYRQQTAYSARLKKSKESIIFAMSNLSSLRDQETGGHLERCREYVKLIATELRADRELRRYVDAEYIDALSNVAPLHDIGKVGISDTILRKPGKLTDEEYEIMKTHSALGASILEAARERLPFGSELELAIELTRHHHERWDGTGYPDRLAGESIPLSARIMAIADVYDALRSERYYKRAFGHEESIGIIVEGAGTQFDPSLTAIVAAYGGRLEKIYNAIS